MFASWVCISDQGCSFGGFRTADNYDLFIGFEPSHDGEGQSTPRHTVDGYEAAPSRRHYADGPHVVSVVVQLDRSDGQRHCIDTVGGEMSLIIQGEEGWPSG